MATVHIFQICKNKCGFYCWWWYQPPKWWPPMKAHLGRWANLNTSYICNLRSLWCKGWWDHFRICSFHIFKKPTLNSLAPKFPTNLSQMDDLQQVRLGRASSRWGGVTWDCSGENPSNQTKPNQRLPNQTKSTSPKPNQIRLKLNQSWNLQVYSSLPDGLSLQVKISVGKKNLWPDVWLENV